MKMIEKTLTVLALVLLVFSSCRGELRPDEPLIFFLEANGGSKSCLIALRHFSVKPAIESAQILDCEKRANALVMEANPALKQAPFWSNYERKMGDPALSDLSEVTRRKIVPALEAAQYTEKEINYFLTLHPLAVYRALMYAKVMGPKVQAAPNLDMQLALVATSKKFKIIEMEGMARYFKNERQLEIEKIDLLISRMCDLLLQPGHLAVYAAEAERYALASDYASIDAGWNNKLRFNTVAMGLPDFTISHDVDSRNPALVDGMLDAMASHGPVLIFIGIAHMGGPNGILKLLAARGVKITRIQ